MALKIIYKKFTKPFLRLVFKLAKPASINLYGFYLYIRKKTFKTSSASRMHWLAGKTGRYGSHIAAICIIVFVLAHNLQATAGNERTASNEMIFLAFLKNGSAQGDIIETSVEAKLAGISRKFGTAHAVGYLPLPQMEAENEQEQEFELPGTSAGGTTLIKPIIANDEPMLAQQKLLEGILTYEIQEGDTINTIARKFGISSNTILWENKLRSRDYIKPGQKLTILPTSGFRHTVRKGDSLKRIASRYKTDSEKILQFNEINDPSMIRPGQKIFIPEGAPLYTPAPAAQVSAARYIKQKIFNKSTNTPNPASGMIWPAKGRVITQYYHWRHHGLDVDGITGDPIYAVSDGTATVSAWNSGGYGLQVVVNHGNGVVTRSAHCSKLVVRAGQKVKAGDVICLMGSTGRSTGSHLHFEVIINGVRRNPLLYIKR